MSQQVTPEQQAAAENCMSDHYAGQICEECETDLTGDARLMRSVIGGTDRQVASGPMASMRGAGAIPRPRGAQGPGQARRRRGNLRPLHPRPLRGIHRHQRGH